MLPAKLYLNVYFNTGMKSRRLFFEFRFHTKFEK